VEKIQRYLEQGGRLLVAFNSFTVMSRRPTGLEKLLARWGVEVGQNVVLDPDNASHATGMDPKPVNPGSHPIVNSLGNAQVHLMLPRSLRATQAANARGDGAKVDELLLTGPKTQVVTDPERGRYVGKPAPPQPLAVAVEKSIPALERGSTRIVAVGDSTFWANQLIDVDANSEFVAYTVNWLVSQNILLGEISRQAIKTYKLTMTRSQMRNVRWLLLGGMPAAVLLLGFVVSVRRRN
jgi:ABC-type uncharacterized transport system involved in gliding motility auxiliary subunit